ncbi:hypothetical protein PbJCM13498_40510 [Prolixibacter bellariivorans]|uniref:DUF4194 domain-containing protein n=1 Tax=Prolixibacter bellariivorans TaxID=314319 RepID=A0A5M4B5T7_9BACT|nr:hypothetical protein [Prolixibacter bellariivorans]GET35188.1 hypothetical protein PbJCM13498_40510 [Prolixibacter bellariivorans]
MENEDFKEGVRTPFSFLSETLAQEHFADLNIELLRGRHVQSDQYYLFQLLTQFYGDLKHYYRILYGLELVVGVAAERRFYYLDFPEEGRGRLDKISRSKELTVIQTMYGLMLLNMFYDRYFEYPKEIRFEDIEYEVIQGENSALYKKLLFGEDRETYSNPEWTNPIKSIKSVIRDFEKLGWVQRLLNEDGEEIHFIIKEPILRFQKLYEKEIEKFEEFVESYKQQKS